MARLAYLLLAVGVLFFSGQAWAQLKELQVGEAYTGPMVFCDTKEQIEQIALMDAEHGLEAARELFRLMMQGEADSNPNGEPACGLQPLRFVILEVADVHTVSRGDEQKDMTIVKIRASNRVFWAMTPHPVVNGADI